MNYVLIQGGDFVKKEYSVFLSRSGRETDSGVRMYIMAETEFEAMQIALRRAAPGYKVASIKLK